MTTQRYHKIAEEPKLNTDLPEPKNHLYSELDVTNEALREYLFQLSIDPDRNKFTKRDRAHVATKILYRIEEHHKMARNGRPHYPPFSWTLVENFAKTPPFTYQEYSTPLAGGGKPGQDAESNSPRILAPAHPQEDTEMNETCKICGGRFNSPFNDPDDDICPECRGEWSRNYQEEMSHEPPENEEPDTWSLDEQLHHFNRKVSTEEVKKHD